MGTAFARIPAADRSAFVNTLRVLIEVLAEDVEPGATPVWPTPN
jgi:hypothetical protein